MIYLGNYAEYVQPEWLSYLKENTGVRRPSEGKATPKEETTRAQESGYSLDNVLWYQFSYKNFPYEIINPPFIEEEIMEWWFMKYLPGNIIPMHCDETASKTLGSNRYTIFLQDYEPGHIFLYESSKILVDYKFGDAYKWNDVNNYHGAANIGYTSRYTLQFCTK